MKVHIGKIQNILGLLKDNLSELKEKVFLFMTIISIVSMCGVGRVSPIFANPSRGTTSVSQLIYDSSNRSKPENSQKPKTHTVFLPIVRKNDIQNPLHSINIIYICACDNNLEEWCDVTIKQYLEPIGSSKDVHTYVLFDMAPSSNEGTILYAITGGGKTLIKDYGEMNMGDPFALANVDKYIRIHDPAERTFYVFYAHGSGSLDPASLNSAGLRPLPMDVLIDETDHDSLDMNELTEFLMLATNGGEHPLSGIVWAACFMQNMGVVSQAFDQEKGPLVLYVGGTPNISSTKSYRYDEIMRRILENPGMSTLAIMRLFGEYYKPELPGATDIDDYGIVDVTKLREFEISMAKVTQALMGYLPTYREKILAAREQTRHMGGGFDVPDYYEDYYDLQELLEALGDQFYGYPNSRVFMEALDYFPIVWGRNTSLSIYFPEDGIPSFLFYRNNFTSATGWDEFLNRFAER